MCPSISQLRHDIIQGNNVQLAWLTAIKKERLSDLWSLSRCLHFWVGLQEGVFIISCRLLMSLVENDYIIHHFGEEKDIEGKGGFALGLQLRK